MCVSEYGLFTKKPFTTLPSFLYYVTRFHAFKY